MFLAMFSIMGAARTLPEFMHTLYTHGFYHSLCIPSFIENDRVSGFWTWMFVLSKVFLTALIKNSFLVIKVFPILLLRFPSWVTQSLSCSGSRS